MPRFNVNSFVWVKLTDKGREVYNAHWEPFSAGNYQAPKVSYDGWSRFQLHELMNVFGPAMTMGGDVPFETEIILDCERPILPDELRTERQA